MQPRTVISTVVPIALLTAYVLFADTGDWGTRVFVAGSLTMWVLRNRYDHTRNGPLAETRIDITEKLVLLAAAMGVMVLPWVTIFWSWPAAWVAPATPAAVIAGAVIYLIADLLFWRSHADLGRQWSPTLEIKQDHTLITRGVYRWVRHPMYAAMWLMAIAQALLVPHWAGALSGLVGFGAVYVTRINREEAMMRDLFGRAWDEYVRRTGRLIPRWRGPA
ncbi:MAG: isoprenylcysteine carboxylmethyltransferase family protein [Methylacidiphilales bacterium]|nr:isoprenylcysteine carboxylmethyltransferase family protein [Candidatus Methylacidiphilales bacterium]